MERTSGTTVAVTSEEVRSALGRSKTLTSEEEKVLRLRHGVGVNEKNAPLPCAAGKNEELADELLLIEMQLQRAFRAHTGGRRLALVRENTRDTSEKPRHGARNAAKDKIVRALRKKH